MQKVTNENYFSQKISQIYTGSSEVKNMIQCEASTLARLRGEWNEEKSESLLISSYLDEKISGTLDNFKAENPQIFTKQGELKSQYKHIEEIYNEINSERNALFKKYLSGEHQTIMVGEISGVPVKIKTDSYFPGRAIIDLKCVKDFKPIFNEKTHEKQNFVDFYRLYNSAVLFIKRWFFKTQVKDYPL